MVGHETRDFVTLFLNKFVKQIPARKSLHFSYRSFPDPSFPAEDYNSEDASHSSNRNYEFRIFVILDTQHKFEFVWLAMTFSFDAWLKSYCRKTGWKTWILGTTNNSVFQLWESELCYGLFSRIYRGVLAVGISAFVFYWQETNLEGPLYENEKLGTGFDSVLCTLSNEWSSEITDNVRWSVFEDDWRRTQINFDSNRKCRSTFFSFL